MPTLSPAFRSVAKASKPKTSTPKARRSVSTPKAHRPADIRGVRTADQRAASLLFGLPNSTKSGIDVDYISAMNYSALYAGVTLISESLASLVKDVTNTRLINGIEQVLPARTHPGWKLINVSPDGIRTGYSLIESMSMHALCCGNGYAELIQNGRGQGVKAHLLLPGTVEMQLDREGIPFYRITDRYRGHRVVLPMNMLHLRAPSWDGLEGISPITRARESIGLGLAAEKYGAQFFGGGGHLKGFITKPNRIGEKERKSLQREWMIMHGDVDNALQIGVLSGGMDWKQMGLSNEDAQFLQTRKFQVNEIARWLRIPPHMLGELDNAKYDNIEHMLIEFKTFTLTPWIRRWETELNMKLFTPDEQRTYQVTFDLNSLQAADSAVMAEVRERQLRNGVLTPDEWRTAERRPVYPDGSGNKPLIMGSQMVTLEAVATGKTVLQQNASGGSNVKPASNRRKKAASTKAKA